MPNFLWAVVQGINLLDWLFWAGLVIVVLLVFAAVAIVHAREDED